jgi:hypothetical protein
VGVDGADRAEEASRGAAGRHRSPGGLAEKDRILALDPTKFFTEPHYNGFPAILVNLPTMTVRELEPLIKEAWRCQAPKDFKA